MAIARKCIEPFESVRVPRVPFPCVVHMSAKQPWPCFENSIHMIKKKKGLHVSLALLMDI